MERQRKRRRRTRGPMPKREDETRQSLSGKHPVYCTCTRCTERFLQKKGIKPGSASKKDLLGKAGREKVRAHPDGCACATCSLLRSVGNLPPLENRKPGLLQRLLGRK